ncbi:hypothetical protein [Nonomuraea sp. NPDC050643]|uniref:hypothetical protein n=1 Tax=Nonomuraea sp. NPDC050643 TaxID=3155660 RepID=UPI0033E4BE9D
MKKMITGAAACGTLLATGTPAQAAPKDPVRALTAQFAPGQGVRFTEKANWSDGTDTLQAQTSKGVLQFDRKGLAAYDITTTSWDDEKSRTIAIGRTAYHSGGILTKMLPKGKTWFKRKGGGAPPGVYGQILNPAEPTTLSALIENGARAGGKVAGVITFKELAKVSPWFARSGVSTWAAETKIDYTLTLTSAGLVGKLSSSYTATGVKNDYSEFEGSVVTVDTRYTGWGSKVSVKAPNPKTVTDKLFD